MRKLVLALLAASLVFLGAVATSSAEVARPGGVFVCDGFTGCYVGGFSITGHGTCDGDFVDGPFRCTAFYPGVSLQSAPATLVYPDAECLLYSSHFDGTRFVYTLMYSSSATIVQRQGPDGLTISVLCRRNTLA